MRSAKKNEKRVVNEPGGKLAVGLVAETTVKG